VSPLTGGGGGQAEANEEVLDGVEIMLAAGRAQLVALIEMLGQSEPNLGTGRRCYVAFS